MFSKVCLALLLSPAMGFVPPAAPAARSAGVVSESKADLQTLATNLNPVVPFWDPLGWSELELWNTNEAATIGFLRHAEIKHGRVAMAAFIGYVVQSNGIRFPFPIQLDGTGYPSSSLTPPEQWDALSYQAKCQIILGIGVLEFFGELNPEWAGGGDNRSFQSEKKTSATAPHYMSGGIPGKFYPFPTKALPFPLWDPMGGVAKRSAEANAKGLLAEINNGRLAMIGIMGFLAESKVAGSVPLGPKLPHYAGDFMAPFSGNSGAPFVDSMNALADPFL